ncbi:MAG: hypothetical protein KGR98_00705 [Verrucomicrobia bacterium]|nr:hypothetical protein [Verrucomicrobiota bacterium]MDE3098005.1 hypothetical protein [Verrucomicrobiota bacterium]
MEYQKRVQWIVLTRSHVNAGAIQAIRPILPCRSIGVNEKGNANVRKMSVKIISKKSGSPVSCCNNANKRYKGTYRKKMQKLTIDFSKMPAIGFFKPIRAGVNSPPRTSTTFNATPLPIFHGGFSLARGRTCSLKRI